MKRIMCIWFPGWPIQRLRIARPRRLDEWGGKGRKETSVILYGPGDRGKLVVTACSENAARHGVVRGMSPTEAQALVPAAYFQRHDTCADRDALRRLALECQCLSPIVALEETDEPHSLLLDITGCDHLFGGEDAMLKKVAARLSHLGFATRIAVADTVGAAWAIAHEPSERRVPSGAWRDRTEVFTRGLPRATYQSLRIEGLRLSAAALRLLHAFDIRRLGQLLELPREDLPGRFGREVVLRLDQILGDIPELLTSEFEPPSVEASCSLESPTGDGRVIENMLQYALERVLAQLQSRQMGIRRLVCSLRLPEREPVSIHIGLLQSSSSSRHLLELVRLRLERLQLKAAVSEVTVRAAEITRLEYHQQLMFTKDLAAERSRHLLILVEQLSSRLGEKVVLRSRLQPDSQPELAWRYEPWLRQDEGKLSQKSLASAAGSKSDSSRSDWALLRPLLLKRPPIRISVASIVPGGLPISFTWEGRDYTVVQVWGPERIETGWWRGNAIRRDYYLVEETCGERFWLFCNVHEQIWFLHGTFI